MVNKDNINYNIDFINEHIKSIVNIETYKEGLLGINKENNLIYINITNKIIEKYIKIHYNSFMFRCIKCSSKEGRCLVLTAKKILYVDVASETILSEFATDINLINFIFIKMIY